METDPGSWRRFRAGRWRYLPAAVVILVGVCLSGVLFVIFRAAEGRDVKQELRLEAEGRSWVIRRTLAEQMLAMESVRALYAASVEVERHEFRAFVQPILAGVSEMETLAWAPREPAADRAAFEARMGLEFGSGFRITQLAPGGELVPASGRAEYFPVVYVEPVAGKEEAIGFDLASDETRREAIERARDTGEVSSTGRVSAPVGGEPAVMLMAPVYAGGVTPPAVADRRARLEGVIAGSVRLSAVFADALAGIPAEELDVQVFDRSARDGGQLLYCFRAGSARCRVAQGGLEGPGAEHAEMLEVGGRRWEVVFTAMPAFEAARRTWVPWGVLLASLAVTGLAGAYLVNATRHALREQLQGARLREANRELTREIAQRKEAEGQRRRLEEQVRHAQKLESLGVLAGGIAHDFNNILMGVLGNADLALVDLPTASPVRENLEEIRRAATRAADLCRQMLAYSGRGRFVVEPVDLSEVAREMAQMLAVSIPVNVALKYDLAEDLPAVEADVTQIRQVVMNLITNAAEAIGEAEGTITVATGGRWCDRASLDETYLPENLPEGMYVTLEVSDTGCGMDAETKARMFDPFYSTKFAGRGLGLAALLGTVRGHAGAVKVDSQVGRGTTVTVLLPASGRPVAAPATGKPEPVSWRGSGTVLLADDEEAVRAVGARMLQAIGLDVVTAADGREAVEMYRREPRRFDCVILDLTMPHMDGEAALRQLRRIDPDARVVLSSGYDEQEVTARFGEAGLAGFIQKPYRLDDLAGRMKQVLGGE